MLEMSEPVIDELARKIAGYLDPDALWSYTEIAAFGKLSPDHVKSYISRLPDFPQPVRTPTATSSRGGHPRYYAKEVKQWFAKYQQGRGRPRKERS